MLARDFYAQSTMNVPSSAVDILTEDCCPNVCLFVETLFRDVEVQIEFGCVEQKSGRVLTGWFDDHVIALGPLLFYPSTDYRMTSLSSPLVVQQEIPITILFRFPKIVIYRSSGKPR